MPSLFSSQDRIAIVHRLEGLTPDSKRIWGTLVVHQMVCHLIDGFIVTFGEDTYDVHDSWRNTWYGRLIAIDLPLRWRKRKLRAPPEFFYTPASHDFLWDRNRAIEYVHRFANGPHQAWGVHPIFGKLSPRQWGKLDWKHLDHHLRQFDC